MPDLVRATLRCIAVGPSTLEGDDIVLCQVNVSNHPVFIEDNTATNSEARSWLEYRGASALSV
jgi:hypothetical protein